MNNFGNFIGGLFGSSMTQVNANTVTGTFTGSGQALHVPYYGPSTVQSFRTQVFTSASSTQWVWQSQKKIYHTHETADGFETLTAYVQALLKCEKDCECKWCHASELERQVAIAQLFKEEPSEEVGEANAVQSEVESEASREAAGV